MVSFKRHLKKEHVWFYERHIDCRSKKTEKKEVGETLLDNLTEVDDVETVCHNDIELGSDDEKQNYFDTQAEGFVEGVNSS